MNLVTALDRATIDHLKVDEHRTIVIYHSTILVLIVTEGETTAAREYVVELWEQPVNDLKRDLDDPLTAFIDEVLATGGTTRL